MVKLLVVKFINNKNFTHYFVFLRVKTPISVYINTKNASFLHLI